MARKEQRTGSVTRRFLLALGLALLLSTLGSFARSTRTLVPYQAAQPMAFTNQHSGHDASSPHVLTVAVDGAVSPDSIPDDLAYSHFLRAVADSDWPDVILKAAGLGPTDRGAFVSAMGPLRQELAELAAQRSATSALQTMGHLKDVEQTVVAQARDRAFSALSLAGQARLDHHIREHVKSRIKVFRMPMPAPTEVAP